MLGKKERLTLCIIFFYVRKCYFKEVQSVLTFAARKEKEAISEVLGRSSTTKNIKTKFHILLFYIEVKSSLGLVENSSHILDVYFSAVFFFNNNN